MADWRKLFVPMPNNALEFFPPTIVDGIPIVEPPEDVFDGGNALWKNSLVAQFLGKPPSFSFVQRTLIKLWEKKGTVTINLAGQNLYIFKFDDSTVSDWVFENGPWHVMHIPMVLRKWEPNLGRIDFNHDKLPLWFHLHNIPLELYSRKGISHLASAIGTPLYMDSITASRERLAYAKVCIEVSAAIDPPELVYVKLKNGITTSVGVSIPWKPPVCKICNTFGHNDKVCMVKKKAIQVWVPKADGAPFSNKENIPNEAGAPKENEETSASPVNVTKTVLLVDKAQVQDLPLRGTPITPEIARSPSADSLALVPVTRKQNTDVTSKFTSAQKMKSPCVPSSMKSKHLISSSTNKFALLNEELEDFDEEYENIEGSDKIGRPPDNSVGTWNHLVTTAKHTTRIPREASKGVDRILLEMKSKKTQIMAKGAIKKPSPTVVGVRKR